MAGAYRQERNIEKSLMEEIRSILTANSYTKITVVKSFKQASKITLTSEEKNGIIVAKITNTRHPGAEVGSRQTIRKPLIIIDIFGTSDGQIKDIKDLLISELKDGFTYYEWTTTGGVTSDATYESGETANGKIVVEEISDGEVNLGEDKSQLDVQDRYRWRITISSYKTLLEA
jgi:hypothetical protein